MMIVFIVLGTITAVTCLIVERVDAKDRRAARQAQSVQPAE